MSQVSLANSKGNAIVFYDATNQAGASILCDDAATLEEVKLRVKEAAEAQLNGIAIVAIQLKSVRVISSVCEGEQVFRFHALSTVEQLKNDILMRTGIATVDQTLICNGRQLRDDQRLEDCGVRDDSSIVLEAKNNGKIERKG
ncbi:MAG: hypothetical protein K1X28_07410 [Parachlamydiales bacterium]|nr:hypothetical protein [Parachlamydiales bacterium]